MLVAAAAHAQDEPVVAELQNVGPDQDPNFQVNSSLSGTQYSLSNIPGVPDTSGDRATLSMELIAFGAPLHDDDSPYSLQAFMQRENTVTVSVTGEGSTRPIPTAASIARNGSPAWEARSTRI